MAETSRKLRIAACIALDILDLTLGRIPAFGVGFDIGLAIIAAAMWGHRGWWHLWEVLDVSEQLCGFVPTCTLIAFSAARAERNEEILRQTEAARARQAHPVPATLSLPSS